MAFTYKTFLKTRIDIAPLGIERGGDHVAYFCTPKGADIFGSAGVDGIHFCFIKGFGEMVFAISPMNCPGEYVHPIARSFEDLLSLLVSTSHIAAIALIGTYTMCNFFRLTGATDLKFHYAIHEFLLFVCLDIIVGFVFSLYFRHKISKINIIDTIRNG